MMFRKLDTPPIAQTNAPSQIPAMTAITAKPWNMARQDLVPTHVDISQSGNKKAARSWRKPLPTASATAPHTANCFSPFQQRQQQYAVNKENSARFGRNGPSRPECQKTGFTRSNRTAAIPAQAENIRFARENATGRHSPLTSNEITTKVRSASRTKKFTSRPKKTKNG